MANILAQSTSFVIFFTLMGTIILAMLGRTPASKEYANHLVLSRGSAFACLITAFAWLLANSYPQISPGPASVPIIRESLLYSLSTLAVILSFSSFAQLLTANQQFDKRLGRFLTLFKVLIGVGLINRSIAQFLWYPSLLTEKGYRIPEDTLRAIIYAVTAYLIVSTIFYFIIASGSKFKTRIDPGTVCLAIFSTVFFRFFMTVEGLLPHTSFVTEPVVLSSIFPIVVFWMSSKVLRQQQHAALEGNN